MSMMTVRELSQDTSGAIHRVEVGEEIQVTKNGQLVAIIVPVGEEQRRRAALVAAGLAETAGVPGGLLDLEPLPARTDRPTLSEVLAGMRDES
ncbi:MAG: type II toxin-antitoxin system Phd/YefM family antitoxin [Micromonosporaceae bacterium]|nr:type II toxin-antitoxin system Phd/YefM family antitoxin [Micromonosporaceae bacterium]